MSRDLSPDFAAALSNPNVRPIMLFDGNFASGAVRFWTGLGSLQWDGREWVGGGSLLGVSPMEEVDGIVAAGATVTLSGVPSGLVQIAIAEAQQGLIGRCWFGLLTDAGEVIADTAQMFAGRLDVPRLQANAETFTIQIAYESRLIDMDRPREFRYTDQDQRAIYPDDAGFAFVAGLQEAEVTWGRQ